ncbi:MAG: hypothetical protein ACREFX_04620 [Opitutaceae bacterium]
MWQKLRDQIPTIVIIVIVLAGVAYWVHVQTVEDMTLKEQADLAPVREQNDVLKAETEENRQQLALLNQTLKDAITKRSADVFQTDEELQKLNQQRMNALAEAIAKKMEPYNPLPRTPQEAERLQNEQIDKVSSRMAVKIRPILDQMASDQHLTRQSVAQYSQRISDEVSGVLTSEMAKNQKLNDNLQETQEVAQESLALSHEITALYLSSFKDQGLITRLLSLPANVVKDAASLSIVNSRDKKKVEQDLVNRMNAIDERLRQIEAQNPETTTPAPARAQSAPTRPRKATQPAAR